MNYMVPIAGGFPRKVWMVLQLGLVLSISNFTLQAQINRSYSFIVAGHTYGGHAGTNIGLYPKFLASLDAGFDTLTRFMVFTGDLVNNSTAESWQQVEQELNKYAMPYYYSMGNHDANAIGTSVFEAKFGKTYYSFDYQKERYIILNSTEKERSISAVQLEFLKEKISNTGDTINKVFVFFHEVLWNSLEKYKGVLANSRSRYDQIKAYSNYWSAVHPILEQYPDKEFYVFAGDVGGNTDAISAFYDKWGHITLLASGMGEVADENYLVVTVKDDGPVAFNLVPLNAGVTLKEIEYYSVPKQPEFILGDTIVSPNVTYEYSVAEAFNADSYNWELPEHASGTSTGNSIQVLFDTSFTSGTISVSASKSSFGSSYPASKTVSLSATSIKIEKAEILEVNVYRKSQNDILELYSESADDFQIEIFTFDGRIIYKDMVRTLGGIEKEIVLPVLSQSIYLVSVKGNHIKKVKKCLMGS
jgi:hypothetical protein